MLVPKGCDRDRSVGTAGRIGCDGAGAARRRPLGARCDQTFRDENGDVQEEVRVTCDLVPAKKVTLIQTCYRAIPDRSFGAMRVDGVSPYTIALQCVTR